LPRRQNSRSIQLLIVTRKPQLGQALSEVFLCNRAVNVVGVSESVTDVTFSNVQPNMILLNLDACSNDVRETLRHCRSSSPHARICILAPDLDEGTMQRCFDAKADGYMVADTSPMQLIGALKVVAMGSFYCDARLAARKPSANVVSRLSSLSPEGLKIVRLITRGYSTDEIHLEMGIPEDDVKDSIRDIYALLGIPKRVSVSVDTIATGSN
jgi:DNA-binding NarL/FixJ family response regulator